MRPLSVRIIGPCEGVSGYDRVVRGFARGLAAVGVDVQLEPFAGWSPALLPADRDPWFEQMPRDAWPADVALHVLMPDRCRPVPSLVNVNYTMFEASPIPPAWVQLAAEHAAIVVPTEGCRAIWVKSGVPASKVQVCGQAVDGELFAQPAPPLDLVGPGGRPVHTFRRRFLHVGEVRPRKNHLGLLRTWLRATTSDDDAILILKLRLPQHALDSFADDVARMEEQVGRPLDDAAPVLVLTRMLDDRQMRSLYRSATHYLTLSHGEGWDMAVMEAAVCALSLVVPEHRIYREYLGPRDAHWIPSREVDAVPDGVTGREDFVYFDGVRWGQPDEAAAARIVAEIVASDLVKPPPSAAIASRFTWQAAGQRMASVLEDVLAASSTA